MRIFLHAGALLLAASGPALAGGWTLPEGDVQAIVTLQYSFASEAFDEDGDTVAIEPFEKFELRGYVEYGVTDWATLVVQPVLRRKEQGDERSDGLGRLDVGGRVRVWSSDAAVASLGASVSAPGQSDRLEPLNGGDTEWEIEFRGLYGLGFDIGERHGFLDAQAGYRHRFEEPADEVVADLTVGLDISEGAFAMVQSFNTVSVGSAKDPFTETSEHKLALSTVHDLGGGWSIQAGAVATAYGRSVLREQGFFAALWRAF